jgi:hypothetical protein
MRIVNLTPHDITIRRASAPDTVYPASGVQARVSMLTVPADPLDDGTPTCIIEYGAAELPVDPFADYLDPLARIVSTMFADAYRRQHGQDGVILLVPDSGPSAIRENGQVVAVTRLIRR